MSENLPLPQSMGKALCTASFTMKDWLNTPCVAGGLRRVVSASCEEKKASCVLAWGILFHKMMVVSGSTSRSAWVHCLGSPQTRGSSSGGFDPGVLV